MSGYQIINIPLNAPEESVGEAYDQAWITVYCLCKLDDPILDELKAGLAEPKYVEPSGMKFKIIQWEKPQDGTEVDMLKIAKKAGRGLLVFADRQTMEDRSVRMSDYAVWDDGWGEEAGNEEGLKGEGLNWGRLAPEEVLNAWMNIESGSQELEEVVGSMSLVRWALLQSGKVG